MFKVSVSINYERHYNGISIHSAINTVVQNTNVANIIYQELKLRKNFCTSTKCTNLARFICLEYKRIINFAVVFPSTLLYNKKMTTNIYNQSRKTIKSNKQEVIHLNLENH